MSVLVFAVDSLDCTRIAIKRKRQIAWNSYSLQAQSKCITQSHSFFLSTYLSFILIYSNGIGPGKNGVYCMLNMRHYSEKNYAKMQMIEKETSLNLYAFERSKREKNHLDCLACFNMFVIHSVLIWRFQCVCAFV